jgi:hypothetical protein
LLPLFLLLLPLLLLLLLTLSAADSASTCSFLCRCFQLPQLMLSAVAADAFSCCFH